MDELIKKRERMVIESILEDERLTAELDDDAAKVLINWGIKCATLVVQSTAGLDDMQAEENMYLQLKSLRRMMRAVNKWVAGDQQGKTDTETKTKLLDLIVEEAGYVYRHTIIPPADSQRINFIEEHPNFSENASGNITDLRGFIENSPAEFTPI